MIKSNELKPCPFCGEICIALFHYDPFDGYQGDCGRYVARCVRCYATIERRNEKEAVAAWNRRANDEQR